jgi:hypothetical protein
MLKGLLKYWLALFILLTTGSNYLSASSLIFNESNECSVNSSHHFSDLTIKSPLSSSEHKIDLAEKEIEVEEDESELHFTLLAIFNYSSAFQTQTAGFFLSDNNQDIPFYLIFRTIRI